VVSEGGGDLLTLSRSARWRRGDPRLRPSRSGAPPTPGRWWRCNRSFKIFSCQGVGAWPIHRARRRHGGAQSGSAAVRAGSKPRRALPIRGAAVLRKRCPILGDRVLSGQGGFVRLLGPERRAHRAGRFSGLRHKRAELPLRERISEVVSGRLGFRGLRVLGPALFDIVRRGRDARAALRRASRVRALVRGFGCEVVSGRGHWSASRVSQATA
jgi:hypothetical protein